MSWSLPTGNKANRLKRSHLSSGTFSALVRLWKSSKTFEAFAQRPKCLKSSRAKPQQRHGSSEVMLRTRRERCSTFFGRAG